MSFLRIQVLGPVSAWRDGVQLDLGPSAQRAVLGLLALAYGRPLPRMEIMDGIWPEGEPPATAVNVIQTYVKRLRRILEPDRRPRAPSTVIRHMGDGYVLLGSAAIVDMLEFRDAVASALASERQGHLDRAVALLEGALRLWHGPPCVDLPLLAGHPKVAALAGERRAALARYGDMMIAAGWATDCLPTLEEAAAAQPLDESWQARLIRAYHAAGRRGQAFATYHEVRGRLAHELGVDPGVELLAVHAALLHDTQQSGSVWRAAGQAAGTLPAQLPSDAPDLVGRSDEIARLDALLTRRGDPARSTSGVRASMVVLHGAPGVGKTALAMRWGHTVASHFPDGQLYLNLRGFDPDSVAMDPADALLRFFDALGVPADLVPSTTDARAAMYRSYLAGRRVLIVLDNVRDAAQVRPLLPGTPGCVVLATSRNQLPSLIATENAFPIELHPLSPGESQALLSRRIGTDRTAREPEAVAEILHSCAGLPLALVIIAARAALNDQVSLATLADRLRRGRDRLDMLSTDGDANTDIRAVVSWSYQALSPEAARLFRLLGLHPGPEFSVRAVASMAALNRPEVQRLLAELAQASLVTRLPDDRYTLNDLLRTIAAELAEQTDSGRQRRAAVRRMFDYYLHSTYAADRLLYPNRDQSPHMPPARGVDPERPQDVKAALAWFTAERAVLVRTVRRAARALPAIPGSLSGRWRPTWTGGGTGTV